MKKFWVIFLAVTLVFCMTACSATGFASKGQVNKLVNNYADENGNIQVKASINYTDADGHEVVVEIMSKLHLSKAPITVANFVALVLDGHYDNIVFDSLYSARNTVGLLAGAYTYDAEAQHEEEDAKLVYDQHEDADFTIKGEFVSNFYEANDLTHQLGALVMWHDTYTSSADYDTANTYFYMTCSSGNLNDDGEVVYSNDKNFAVFATIAEGGISVYYDGDIQHQGISQIPAWVLDDIYLNNQNYNSIEVNGEFESDGDPVVDSCLSRLVYVSGWEFVEDQDLSGLVDFAEKYRNN